MSDKFLYEAAPAVREAFANALFARLSRSGHTVAAFPGWVGFNRKTAAYALSAVLVTVIAVACARELFKQRYVQVGDMWVLEVPSVITERLDFFESPENALSLPPTPIPVADAAQMLPYDFHMPDWLPPGYALLEEEVTPPVYPGWGLNLNWRNERGDYFFLWSQIWDVEIQAPANMWSETKINGMPGVMVRGRFPWFPPPTPGVTGAIEREARWDDQAGLMLVWKQGGGRFQLMTFGDYLTEQDLIRIAESMGGP